MKWLYTNFQMPIIELYLCILESTMKLVVRWTQKKNYCKSTNQCLPHNLACLNEFLCSTFESCTRACKMQWTWFCNRINAYTYVATKWPRLIYSKFIAICNGCEPEIFKLNAKTSEEIEYHIIYAPRDELVHFCKFKIICILFTFYDCCCG